MCGIVGFNWDDKKQCKKITKLLSHRGPDQEGYYNDNLISLGHRRLSILDLSEKGKQPMANKEKTLWIVFNGEIFNYQSIKKELQKKGYKFVSQTDTEVILHGYHAYGKEILKKLNGQFAFCIYDKNKKELFLARDRVGINPLYYYCKKDKFIFGSELKVILETISNKKISKVAFNHYLLYGYTPPKKTIIENAYKLLPGYYMIYDLKNQKIREEEKYWEINVEPIIKDEKTAKELIKKQLEKSVKERLIADVPVGAFLSGGLDSSSIVAMIKKHKQNVKTFSISFDYKQYDEAKYAQQVAKKYNTEHYSINFEAEQIKKMVLNLAYYYDEPFGNPSLIPTYLVSNVARQHVTVSLTGDGSDEIFGGYLLHRYYRLLELQKYYPKWVNLIFYKVLKKINGLEKCKAFFEIGTLKNSLKYPRLLSYLTMDDYQKITKEDPKKIYEEYSHYAQSNHFQTAMYTDLKLYLPGDNLTKVDRASLANSLESRPPFLDHELVELAMKIDPKLKYKRGEGKWILKKAMEPLLPKKIIYRKKQGFGVPIKEYFQKEWKDILEKYVFNFDKHDYIDKNVIREMKHNSRLLFSVLMFNLWYERWM